MITVTDLTKRYGAFTAVDRLSFEVARGEVVGFLGPNGAGKTTTLRILTGYHPASSGTAVLAGHDVAKDSLAVRSKLGYLPQEVPIYPDLRVIEYLRYRAALKGIAKRARAVAVDKAMAKADVQEFARKLCGNVSHGQRQRVGLADALLGDPPILILDEPTSGLDPNQRVRIKQVVRDLAQEHTVLFSSHILGEVQEVSSRVVILHRGRKHADGVTSALLAEAGGSNLFVAVLGEAAALERAMAGIAGLRPGPVRSGDGGTARAVCALDGVGNAIAELAVRLQQAGLPVCEMRVDQPSLEQYFHSLTRDDAPAEAVA